MRRRTRIALVVVGVALSIALPVFADALLSGGKSAGTGVSFNQTDGPNVTVGETVNFTNTNPWATDDRISLEPWANFTSNGNTHVTVDRFNGTWTNVSQLDVTAADLTVDPNDKPPFTVSGDADQLSVFETVAPDDGQVDFVYGGASGVSNVTVRGVTATTDFQAVDADTGTILDVATSDANGNVTFDLPNSIHAVQIQSGSATPLLDDPQPDGDVSTVPSEFSVFVEDDDFPGDTVTVEWFFEGSKFDTTTGISSDGRVSTSNLPTITGGTHPWSVVATDETGNRAILNATVGVPGTIFIRNETNASQLVDSPVNVTVRFFNGTSASTFTTDTGTIDMTGLPTTDFIVELEASQDFVGRTVYFQNIIGNRSVFLLNQSFTTIQSRFVLDDPTGEFPSNSLLIIKRAINLSGTNTYRTIISDRFGAEGVTATLQEDVRYELSVRSPDGTLQPIGPYRATTSETVTLQPGAPDIPVGEFEEGWASNAALDNTTLSVRYSDPEMLTDSVTVWIHEKGNENNQLRPNTTFFSLGNFSAAFTLTANESEQVWTVNLVVDRDDETFVIQHEVENNPGLVFDGLSREWRQIAGILMLLVFAGVFSVLNRTVGAIALGVAGGLLWWTGWLTGATTGAAIVFYLFVAVIYGIYDTGGP